MENSEFIKQGLARLVRESAPGRSAAFGLYWDLLAPHLDELLTEGVPLKRQRGTWRLGVASFSWPRDGDFVGDLVLAALGSLGEARKTGADDRQAVSAIVQSYAKVVKGVSPFHKGLEDFVLSLVSRTIQPSPMTQAVNQLSLPGSLEYVVFEGSNSRAASEKDVAELWTKRDDFVVFVDAVKKGWFYKDGNATRVIPLQPDSLEWYFLCLALQKVGGSWGKTELREAMEKAVGEQFGSELWQLRERLTKKTHGVIGTIVKGKRKGGGYTVSPAYTCLIQKQ